MEQICAYKKLVVVYLYVGHTAGWSVISIASSVKFTLPRGFWGAAAPIQKFCPLWPPSEVHHADILTEV